MQLSVCRPISRCNFKPVVMPTNVHKTVAVETIRYIKITVSFLEDQKQNWWMRMTWNMHTHTHARARALKKREKISLQQRTNNKSSSHKAQLLPVTAHSSRRQQTECLCNQNIWVSNGKTEVENSLRHTQTAWCMLHKNSKSFSNLQVLIWLVGFVQFLRVKVCWIVSVW